MRPAMTVMKTTMTPVVTTVRKPVVAMGYTARTFNRASRDMRPVTTETTGAETAVVGPVSRSKGATLMLSLAALAKYP